MRKPERILLILSLLGINIILLISLVISPKYYKISEIQDLKENNIVKVQGKITSIKNYESFQVLTLSEKNFSVDITSENTGNEFLNKSVIVEGRIREYNLKNQIIASKILAK